MSNNTNLIRAAKQKNDEFYTRYEDVEKHVKVFKKEFYKDKIIYCPFSSDKSNFVKYFQDHKEDLKYKELLYTSDDYKLHEDLFDKADLVIDNPPFSIFISEILPFLMKLYDKQCERINRKLTASQLTASKLTASKLTASKLTASKLTASKLTASTDFPIWCSGIYLHSFITPENTISLVPATSICFACPEDSFTEKQVLPNTKYTYKMLIEQNKLNFVYITKFYTHMSVILYKDIPDEIMKLKGLKLPSFKSIKFFPNDFHGYAVCPITSTISINNKFADTGLFTKYGWKLVALCDTKDYFTHKKNFLKYLIYHE